MLYNKSPTAAKQICLIVNSIIEKYIGVSVSHTGRIIKIIQATQQAFLANTTQALSLENNMGILTYIFKGDKPLMTWVIPLL